MSVEGRPCPPALAERFSAACRSGSDLGEHLDRLRELSVECAHVTEFGVRWADGSTVALLAGQPDTLVSWDINPRAIVSQPIADLLGMAGRTRFQPRVGDTLAITIEPTDFLLIDSLHTARQCQTELERHGPSVRRYLAVHDTVTYGMVGEDGTEPGLRAAIRWFQREHMFPLWRMIEDRQQCNGLVVLEHI